MFKLSKKSEQILNTTDKQLGILTREVSVFTPIDFSIIEGYRDEKTQQKYYNEGKSKYDGIINKSKHQLYKAIDIVGVIEGFNNCKDIYILIGMFIATANKLNIKIRTGALWNYKSVHYNNFIDAFHIELL